MKQTVVEWLINRLGKSGFDFSSNQGNIQKAKEMEKQQKILLVEQLKDYTKEAQCILGNDEREASEFVEIFYKTTFKSE